MIVESLNSVCSNFHVNIIWKSCVVQNIKPNRFLCSFDLVTWKTALNLKISRFFFLDTWYINLSKTQPWNSYIVQ